MRIRRLKAATWVIAAVLPVMITSCNGGEQTAPPPQPAPATGIPTLAEIEKVFKEPVEEAKLLQAYEQILAENPTITQDEERLSRLVFERLKKNILGAQSYSGAIASIKLPEGWAFFKHPIGGYKLYKSRFDAFEKSETSFPCTSGDTNPGMEFNDNKTDAVRHAYFNASAAKIMWETYYPRFRISVDDAIRIAREFGTAHEAGNEYTQRGQMDLANNNAGYEVFRRNEKATNDDLLKIISSLPFEFFEPGVAIPLESSQVGPDGKPMIRLVYYAGKSKYDGEYVGSLTNPDSDTVWDARFYVSECNGNIKGEYVITSGTQYSIRRFSGSLSGGVMQIKMDYPLSWEMRPGYYPCENMVAELTDRFPGFIGAWRSSNCLLGGNIHITKL